MRKIHFLIVFIFISSFSFSQSKDRIIKDLSKNVDSLENELIQIKREISDLKALNPEKFDQANVIQQQGQDINQLAAEKQSLMTTVSRLESQLKFRSRELQDLKVKVKNIGADSLLANIQVSNFRVLPQYAKDCACFYSQDQGDYNNRQFLYIEDENKDCIININNRQERLLFKKDGVFANERFQINFSNKKHIGNAGANKMYDALMTITSLTTKEKLEIPVMGVCGCD